MLDSFLNVSYDHEVKEQLEKEAVALLKQLPAADLFKIASGEKVAWMGAEPCGPGSTSFLDKFKGTPLFEEALALEQEELQAQMTDLERRKERRVEQEGEQGLWDMQEQLRIKKRLLELRLAQEEAGGMGAPALNAAPPPAAGAQEAGGIGSEPAPVEANKMASTKLALAAGEVFKMKSVVSGNAPGRAAQSIGDRLKKAPSALGGVNNELGHFKSLSSTMQAPKTASDLMNGAAAPIIDGWGRELARADFAKAAEAAAFGEAGAVLAKEALDLGALGSMASKFVKNPKNLGTLVGAGTGAIGGLSSGLQKDQNGQRHLLGGVAQGVAGGAVGGLAGHAVQNIGTSVRSGTPLGAAAKQYATGWGSKIRDVASSMQPKAPAQLMA